MNKVIFVFLMAGIFSITTGSVLAHDAPTVILMEAAGFNPAAVTIHAGNTVVFKNTDTQDHWPASNDHPTHEVYSAFDPKRPILPGQEWRFVFSTEGTWQWHDHLYPNQHGVVTVRGSDENFSEGVGPADTFVTAVADYVTALLDRFAWSPKTEPAPQAAEAYRDPAPYLIPTLYESITSTCAKNEECSLTQLVEVITHHGPAAALELLALLEKNGFIHSNDDYHQVAHQIGRATAENFGINSQSFLLCPTSFNYGCGHGFFEYVLGRSASSQEAASRICGSLDDDAAYSDKFKFYCYHGLGHGIMMAEANNLDSSLVICDSLENVSGRIGCWQGVFMQNVVSEIQGEARENVFSAQDPLAPCNRVAPQYRYQCYINHGGYLVGLFNYSARDAAEACLGAGDQATPCIQAIGLLTTNPGWQPLLMKNIPLDPRLDPGLQICNTFSPATRADCFVGALDNIMNYDDLDLQRRAIPFCESAVNWSPAACYRQIGINIMRQEADSLRRQALCEEILLEYQSYCLEWI